MIADFFASEYMSSSTRAIILSFNSYNVPSQYYTSINVVFEQSTAGFIDANFIAIDPFKTPLQNKNRKFRACIVIRFLLVGVSLYVIGKYLHSALGAAHGANKQNLDEKDIVENRQLKF